MYWSNAWVGVFPCELYDRKVLESVIHLMMGLVYYPFGIVNLPAEIIKYIKTIELVWPQVDKDHSPEQLMFQNGMVQQRLVKSNFWIKGDEDDL